MRNASFKSHATSLLGALILGSLTGCATPVEAARWVDVTVLNRSTGERLTPYRYDGKLYIAGKPGDRYGIELHSNDRARVLTVISVDGVNVLTGQTADALQSGYVLSPQQRYAITGWRKSMDEVAQFLFTALPDSYAARTGRPDNVGVIGVAVYREKVAAPPEPMPYRDYGAAVEHDERKALEGRADALGDAPGAAAERASPAPAAPSKAESGGRLNRQDSAPTQAKRQQFAEKESRQRLGTGHGAREHAPTENTEFTRASASPDQVITIYYDSRANLIARGIIRAPKLVEPRPFPGSFVPDPRG